MRLYNHANNPLIRIIINYTNPCITLYRTNMRTAFCIGYNTYM